MHQMTLEKYLSHLNVMVEANPNILKLQVIYSSDDEGSNYDFVKFVPSLMSHKGKEVICIN